MIFLDLVGTITDMEYEERALLLIGEKIKERFGLEHSSSEIWRSIEECRKPSMESRHLRYVPVKNLVAECLNRFLTEIHIPMTEEDVLWIKNIYVEVHERNSRLSKNAEKGIALMREIADHLGVISDADSDYLEGVLRSLKIYDIFDSVTSSEEVGVGKPNPKIFMKAMEKSGPADLLYHVGDSEKRDVMGAINAGMTAIRICPHPTESMASYVATDLYDAAMWIKRNVIIREKEM